MVDLELPSGAANTGNQQVLLGTLVSDASAAGGSLSPAWISISVSGSVV